MTKDEALKLALEALECALSDDKPYIVKSKEAIAAIKEALVAQPEQEAIYGMNPDDWKDVVAAIAKVRDGRGIYLACRPADVFQVWFLALGTAKLKEKHNG
jgi:hypothetical protein